MIKIIFLDVDGCMSDGGITYTNSGDELKRFDVKDGFAIQQWTKSGKIAAIITGKSSAIVDKRGKELGCKYIIQNSHDKLADASKILKDENLSFDEAAAIGDDYNDIKILKAVKFSFKPCDALECVKVTTTLKRAGGAGAVREMIETIIDINGERKEWLAKWL